MGKIANIFILSNPCKIRAGFVFFLVWCFSVLPFQHYHLAHANLHNDENGKVDTHGYIHSIEFEFLLDLFHEQFSDSAKEHKRHCHHHSSSTNEHDADNLFKDASFTLADSPKSGEISLDTSPDFADPDVSRLAARLIWFQPFPPDTRFMKGNNLPAKLQERSPPFPPLVV
ncbi:MAG: hypothetical protein ACE5GQ_05565 [Nitrospinales bacterium]